MPRYRKLLPIALPLVLLVSGGALFIAGHSPGVAWSLLVWGAALMAAVLAGVAFTWESHDDA